jgi:hypothetical protein
MRRQVRKKRRFDQSVTALKVNECHIGFKIKILDCVIGRRRIIINTVSSLCTCQNHYLKAYIYSLPEWPAFRFKETMKLFNIDIDLSRRDA